MSMRDPHRILLDVLAAHSDHPKWLGAPFEKIKHVSNTKVGAVGQDFVEALCGAIGFDVEFPVNPAGERAVQNPWDIKIEGKTFELKTATEDIGGNFQFNHIRYHRRYEAVLCVGIAPDDILFDVWSKAEITTGLAGNLVSMEKGANASYKLTKRKTDLRPIDAFQDDLLAFLAR